MATRGEDLLPVDDLLVAVPHRRRPQRREIGARVRLGVTDREMHLAGEYPGQKSRFLPLGAERL
jgi:hypothetical protein